MEQDLKLFAKYSKMDRNYRHSAAVHTYMKQSYSLEMTRAD